jgi:hypothetical protein
MPDILWTKNFLEAEGFPIVENVVTPTGQSELFSLGEEWKAVELDADETSQPTVRLRQG